MSKIAYNIQLKGYVGGADFDRDAVDEMLAGLPEREANVVVTDGVSKTTLTVHQSRTSGIAVVEAGEAGVYPRVSHDGFTVSGPPAYISSPPPPPQQR